MTEWAAAPHARREVRSMVEMALPGWSVDGASRFGDGENGVYAVTVSNGERHRELVLKAPVGVDDAAFRPEPYVLDAASRRTDVPVPGVVAVVDDGPFFLMERCG